jgi:hypothetical protein
MKYNNVFASELPAAVKAYVQNRFPGQSIAFAEKDVTSLGTGYLVSLNDGTDLCFAPSCTCISEHNRYNDFFPLLI